MSLVFDSGALIALFKNETGASAVAQRIQDAREANEPMFVHAANVCEIFYEYSRAADVLTARRAIQDVVALGVQIHYDLDEAFCEDAAQLKAD